MRLRPGAPLAPLHERRTRILLLAASYDDAVTNTSDGARGDKPSSRALVHDEYLWPRGSYKDFQTAIDSLRVWAKRCWYPSFELVYMRHGSRLVRNERGGVIGYEGHPVTRHLPALIENGRVKRKPRSETTRPVRSFPVIDIPRANECLAILDAALKNSPLYVPAAVSEAAGYLPSEARGFEPAWARKQEAA